MGALDLMKRVRLVGELGAATAALSAAATPMDKIKASVAVGQLLAILGVSADAPAADASPDLVISAADKDGAKAAISAYVESGLPGSDPKLHQFDGEAVRRIAAHLGITVPRVPGGETVTFDDAQMMAAELMKERRVDPGVDAAEVAAGIAKHEDAMKAHAAKAREAEDAFRAERAEAMAAIRSKLNDLMARIRAASGAEADALSAEYVDTAKAFNAESTKVAGAFNASRREAYQKADADNPAVNHGRKIISEIMDKSPVTAEQAAAWAEAQVVKPATLRSLSKQGYAEKALRQDMAEFYRITGGKLPAILIESARANRAHASGIKTVGGVRTVAIDRQFTRGVLWHELGHHLEGDPVAMAAANGFLLRRRESSKTYRLRDLTKIKYRADEIAYKDSWINPYVGKVYSDRATEVFSMAMENLSSPKKAAKLFSADREMFDLVTGYIATSMTPAAKALSRLGVESSDKRKDAEEEAAAKEVKIKAEFDALIKKLAKDVTLTKVTSVEGDPEWPHGKLFRAAARGARDYAATYIGSDGSNHVFTGTFLNYATMRRAKGVVFARMMDGDGVEHVIAHIPVATIPAVLAIANRQGTSVVSVIHSYFEGASRRNGWGDPREALIEWAKDL